MLGSECQRIHWAYSFRFHSLEKNVVFQKKKKDQSIEITIIKFWVQEKKEFSYN